MKNSSLKYYLVLFLSALDILGIAGGAYYIFIYLLSCYSNNSYAFTNDKTVLWLHIILPLVAVFLCFIFLYPLQNLRQKLRDLMEYDGFGVSKKYGDFSKLSAAERKEIEQQKMIDSERILSSSMLKQMTHKGVKNPDEEMRKLIGLKNVKDEMHQMAARMEYEQKKREKDKKKTKYISSMHMCFLGPPGTGKTTCARIMTGFLYQYKYIKKNQCVEVDGNFLKGLSPGENSKKTAMLIQASLGGVLFIDEAYALLESEAGSSGQSIIATIVKAMEDYKDNFILILAGYSQEMKQLVGSNPGIESRIKQYLWFQNYNSAELQEIFRTMANEENFVVSAEAMEGFGALISICIKDKNFGNARTVRNLLDKIINKHATNLMDDILTEDKTYILCGEDTMIKIVDLNSQD